jgi:hypothetical protein
MSAATTTPTATTLPPVPGPDADRQRLQGTNGGSDLVQLGLHGRERAGRARATAMVATGCPQPVETTR